MGALVVIVFFLVAIAPIVVGSERDDEETNI